MKKKIKEHTNDYFLEVEFLSYLKKIENEKNKEKFTRLISKYLEKWPFEEFHLKSWERPVNKCFEKIKMFLSEYMEDRVQIKCVDVVDLNMIVSILKFMQRIYAYSVRKNALKVPEDLICLVYFLEEEIYVEAYKTFILIFPHFMNFELLLSHQDMLMKPFDVGANCLLIEKIKVSENYSKFIPEEVFINDIDFSDMKRLVGEYGQANFIHEYRRRYNDFELYTLLGCTLLVSIAREDDYNKKCLEYIKMENIVEIAKAKNCSNYNFALFSLAKILIRIWYDFEKISALLELEKVDGIFSTEIVKNLKESSLEKIYPFFVLKTLVDNDGIDKVDSELMTNFIRNFDELSSEVRYLYFYCLKVVIMNGSNMGFFNHNGMNRLIEYMKTVEVDNYYETTNICYVIILMNYIYMCNKLTNEKDVGQFEDSSYILLVIETLKKFSDTNEYVVILCLDILTHFMFEEPLNYPVFKERGVLTILDYIPKVNIKYATVRDLFSFFDAYSLNTEFQNIILENRLLSKTLFLCNFSYFLIGQFTECVEVLIMHHPALKDDLVHYCMSSIEGFAKIFKDVTASKGFYEPQKEISERLGGLYELINDISIELPNSDNFYHSFLDCVLDLRYVDSYPSDSYRPRPGTYVLSKCYRKAEKIQQCVNVLFDEIREWLQASDSFGKEYGYSVDSVGQMANISDFEAKTVAIEKQMTHLFNYLITFDQSEEEISREIKIELIYAMGNLLQELTKYEKWIGFDFTWKGNFEIRSECRKLRKEICKMETIDQSRRKLMMVVFCNTYMILENLIYFIGDPAVFSQLFDQFLSVKPEKNGKIIGASLMMKSIVNFSDYHINKVELKNDKKIFENWPIDKLKKFLHSSVEPEIVVQFFHLFVTDENEFKELMLNYFESCSVENNSVLLCINHSFGGIKPYIWIEDEDIERVISIFRRYIEFMNTRNFDEKQIENEDYSIKIINILKNKKYVNDLIQTKSYSGYSAYLTKHPQIYKTATAILNTHFELTKSFINMGVSIFRYASTTFCPHKLDTKAIGYNIPKLIDSDLPISLILNWLIGYVRVVKILKRSIPVINIKKIISKTRGYDDQALLGILLTYLVPVDLNLVKNILPFPSKEELLKSKEGFFRSCLPFFYRDYSFFVKAFMEDLNMDVASFVPPYEKCCKRQGIKQDDTKAYNYNIVNFVFNDLFDMLNDKDSFAVAAKSIVELFYCDSKFIDQFVNYEKLNFLYSVYMENTEITKNFDVGHTSHWALSLLVAIIHLTLEKDQEFEQKPLIVVLIEEKISNGNNKDLLFISFLLSRTLTPYLICSLDNETDMTIERFKNSSKYFKKTGIFNILLDRVGRLTENDLYSQYIIQYSVDYVSKAIKFCHEFIDVNYENERIVSSDAEDYNESEEEDFYDVESFYNSYDTSISFLYDDRSDSVEDEDSSSEVPAPSAVNSDTKPVKDELNFEIRTLSSKIEKEYPRVATLPEHYWENAFFEQVGSDLDFTPRKIGDMDETADIREDEDVTENFLYGSSEDEELIEAEIVVEDDNDFEELNSGAVDIEEVNLEDFEQGEVEDDSILGDENGEMPEIDPLVLNQIDEREVKEVIESYFNERRARASSYVPLHIDFYNSLNENVRELVEDLELEYRSSFYERNNGLTIYDSEGSDTIDKIEISVTEIETEIFKNFMNMCLKRFDFSFSSVWCLIDLLSYDKQFQYIAFEAIYFEIERLRNLAVSFKAEENFKKTELKKISKIFYIEKIDRSKENYKAPGLKRCLNILVDIARNEKGYKNCFKERPTIISLIFDIFSQRDINYEFFELISELSIAFKWDKDFIFGKEMQLDNICSVFSKKVASKWIKSIDTFVKNSGSHFGNIFVDYLLNDINKQMDILEVKIQNRDQFFKKFSKDKIVFFNLWKILCCLIVNHKQPFDHRYSEILKHRLWKIFFDQTAHFDSAEDTEKVSAVYEAFFIIGKILENLTFEDNTEEAKLMESCRAFYKETVASQSKNINLLVEANPDVFFTYTNVLIEPSILSFSNKKQYIYTKLKTKSNESGRTSYGVYVDRNNVLRNSYFQIMAKSASDFRKKRLEVKLAGEEGLDYGGVTREWLGLLIKDLVNPDFALFTYQSEERGTVVPCKNSYINPEHLSYFKFTGRIIAKAIIDNNSLGLHLSNHIYKFILDKKCDINDLEAIDQKFYNSVIWIRDNPITEDLGLTFAVDSVEMGISKVVELVKNGSNISVNEENKLEYLELLAQYKLFDGILLQLKALKEGLEEIIEPDLLKIFDENELELLICGVPEINIDDWKNNTQYYGYQKSSKNIIWFWKAVKSFTDIEKAKLLQFATGSSTLPYEGFSHLQGNNEIQKFSIHKVGSSIDSLPTAHTCFNQLNLPEYTSYDRLVKCLKLAITECSTGFGFI